MTEVMSACGVLCSGCAAFHGNARGISHQRRTAAAWKRIYRLNEKPESLSCGGCQGPEDQLLRFCGACKAQQCCRAKGFGSCAECEVEGCTLLERAQAVWDGVPKVAHNLSREDFAKYAEPYCGHRERLERARQAASSSGRAV
jgi:hypothetical protein